MIGRLRRNDTPSFAPFGEGDSALHILDVSTVMLAHLTCLKCFRGEFDSETSGSNVVRLCLAELRTALRSIRLEDHRSA